MARILGPKIGPQKPGTTTHHTYSLYIYNIIYIYIYYKYIYIYICICVCMRLENDIYIYIFIYTHVYIDSRLESLETQASSPKPQTLN